MEGLIFGILRYPLDINKCESSSCLNNGTCTDRGNEFNAVVHQDFRAIVVKLVSCV